MSSSRPSTKRRPLASKCPDVAGRKKSVDTFLVAPVGVSLEAQPAGDEDPADRVWGGDLLVVLVEQFDVTGHRSAARGSRRNGQILGSRDGGHCDPRWIRTGCRGRTRTRP